VTDQPDRLKVALADRFVREIEIAAQLTHPHILRLFDSGEADGPPKWEAIGAEIQEEPQCAI